METDPIRTLTDAQKEVLRLVHRGMTTKEIAREIGVSAAAVDDRIEAARVKLGHVRRSTAARLLALAEATPTPFGGTPGALGIEWLPPTDQSPDVAGQGDVVREQRAVFDAVGPQPLIVRLGPLARTGIGVAFAITVLMFAALLKPMVDGVSWVVVSTERFFE